jgi:hypothetical protein
MKNLALRTSPWRCWLRSVAAIAGTIGMVLAVSTVRLQAQTWNIQWSDEFNATSGTAPSSSTWTFDTGGGGWGNGELEVYCSPYSSSSPCDPNNSNLYEDGNGNLVIKAINNNGTWTSGRMNPWPRLFRGERHRQSVHLPERRPYRRRQLPYLWCHLDTEPDAVLPGQSLTAILYGDSGEHS